MFCIKPQGTVGWLADKLMVPIMYIMQGTFLESPQRTHRWNNQHLPNHELQTLYSSGMVSHQGDQSANNMWLGWIPLFHLPLFGGWKKYLVIEPNDTTVEWFPGWRLGSYRGFSRIPLNGPVRLLVGPESVEFFGLTKDGRQIPVTLIGEGVVGQGGEFSQVPLR